MRLANFQIKIERNAVYTFFGLAAVFAIITGVLRVLSDELSQTSVVDVLLVAFGASAFLFIAQLIHMLGHILAAWSTGYPKSGMWFMYGFAMSLYPPDEPELPARLHIRRSLGGVVAFALVLAVVLVLWLNTRDSAQWTVRYLTSYMLFISVVLFLVSAVISDGVLFIARKEWLPKPSSTLNPDGSDR